MASPSSNPPRDPEEADNVSSATAQAESIELELSGTESGAANAIDLGRAPAGSDLAFIGSLFE